MPGFKQPISVLVVIYTVADLGSGQTTSTGSGQAQDIRVLLLERADHPGYWQSVTGSVEGQENLAQTAAREVFEETGLDVASHQLSDHLSQNIYEIYPQWRHRYAPGVTHNIEHVFSLKLKEESRVRLSSSEHLQYGWWPWREAAEMVFSPSNRAAILSLAAGEMESHAEGERRSCNE
jgi:dATP pyrophosphohydrolase